MAVRISEVLPNPEFVETGNGKFEVRGLPLTVLPTLIDKYKLEFARLLVLGGDEDPDYMGILNMAPQMAVDIIAYGAGVSDAQEDEIEKAAIAKLPVGVQLIALEKIWRMTVPDPKKVRSLLSRVGIELRGLVGELKRPESATTSSGSAPSSVQ